MNPRPSSQGFIVSGPDDEAAPCVEFRTGSAAVSVTLFDCRPGLDAEGLRAAARQAVADLAERDEAPTAGRHAMPACVFDAWAYRS